VADEPPLGTSMTRRIRERERQYEMYAAGSSQREIIKSFEKETPEVLPRAFRSTMRFKLSSFVEVRHMRNQCLPYLTSFVLEFGDCVRKCKMHNSLALAGLRENGKL